MRLVLLVLALLCLSGSVVAHQAPSGWTYPNHCCSDRDCSPIAPSRVREVPGGYLVDGRWTVEHQHAGDSPDGEYHACFVNNDPETFPPRCFWRPKPSF